MTRQSAEPQGHAMADAGEVPDKFWPAVRWVVNNLAWILPLVTVERVADGHNEIAIVFGALSLADIAIAVKWGLLAEITKTRRRALGLAVVVGGVLLVCVGTYLLVNMRAAATSNSEIVAAVPAVEFVKNQNVAMQYTGNPGQQPAIQYWAQFTYTGQQRLRFFLERARLDFNPSMNVAEKAPLSEFRDYVKDDNIYLPLVTRTETPEKKYEFWWGDPKDGKRFDFDNYRARISVLSDDGKEQHYYFMIIKGRVNDISYPEIIRADILGFPAQWEARDAQR
jgi:hypothetical protein